MRRGEVGGWVGARLYPVGSRPICNGRYESEGDESVALGFNIIARMVMRGEPYLPAIIVKECAQLTFNYYINCTGKGCIYGILDHQPGFALKKKSILCKGQKGGMAQNGGGQEKVF